MRLTLLHNPSAGDEDFSAEELVGLLARAGHRVTYRSTEEPIPGRAKPADDLIVVAGGDGSVRKVVAKMGTAGVPLTILPTGTANNIAASLGIRGEPAELIRAWPAWSLRRLDLGTARYRGGEQVVIEGFGIGVLSRTMDLMPAFDCRSGWEFPRKMDRRYRNICAIAALAAEMPPREVELTLDGETMTERYLLLEAANLSRAGPGLLLAPAADPADGIFEIVMVAADERAMLVENLAALVSGDKLRHPLRTRRARRVGLRCRAGGIHVDDCLLDASCTAGPVAEVEAMLRREALAVWAPPSA